MRYERIARKALKSAIGREKVCAITSKKGRICGIGINKYTKSHPEQERFARRAKQPERIYLHAEIDALIRSFPKPDTIHVYRVNNKGMFLNSKPCPVCELDIKEAGIKYVFHS